MADEPEDVGEASRNPPGQQREARHTRAYSLLLERLHEGSVLPRAEAEKTLILVLCTLKQRLTRDAGEDLRAALPVKFQDALQACEPRHEPSPPHADVETLLRKVAGHLGGDIALAESVTRSMLAMLRAQLTESEAEQVGHALPMDLRALWARPI